VPVGLDRVDLSGLTLGGLMPSFVGSTYTGTAGEVRYNDAIGRLYVDTNGGGASGFSVDLIGAPSLTEDDLILQADGCDPADRVASAHPFRAKSDFKGDTGLSS
jgi:hypothetical protein